MYFSPLLEWIFSQMFSSFCMKKIHPTLVLNEGILTANKYYLSLLLEGWLE